MTSLTSQSQANALPLKYSVINIAHGIKLDALMYLLLSGKTADFKIVKRPITKLIFLPKGNQYLHTTYLKKCNEESITEHRDEQYLGYTYTYVDLRCTLVKL